MKYFTTLHFNFSVEWQNRVKGEATKALNKEIKWKHKLHKMNMNNKINVKL
jgi:hypothetical protein